VTPEDTSDHIFGRGAAGNSYIGLSLLLPACINQGGEKTAPAHFDLQFS